MIVKNEERYLADCLRSVKGLVDEMIIVDTGSTDSTAEIAEKFGAKVIHHPWNDDFAEARNISLDAASFDWVLQLDADEELLDSTPGDMVSGARHLVLGELRSPRTDIYALEIVDLAASEQYHLPRLFKKNNFRYSGKFHETLIRVGSPGAGAAAQDDLKSGNPGDDAANLNASNLKGDDVASSVISLPVRILHKGYGATAVIEKDKFDRNIKALQKAHEQDPSDMSTAFYLGATYQSAGKPDEAVRYYHMVVNSPARAMHPKAFKNLMRCYENLGDHLSSIQTAEAGLELFPAYQALRFHMGVAKYLSKDHSGAAEAFYHCLQGPADPGMPSSIPGIEILSKLFLALSEFEIGKDPNILASLDVLMKELAVNSEAVFFLGKTFINAYGPEKARAETEKIADLKNKDVRRAFKMLFEDR